MQEDFYTHINDYYNPAEAAGQNQQWKNVQEGFQKVNEKNDEQDETDTDQTERIEALESLWAAGEGVNSIVQVYPNYISTASGRGSIAIGSNNEASGVGSFAGGDSSKATSYRNLAFGYGCETSGNDAVAIGQNCKAENRLAMACGYETQASGEDSHSEGTRTVASGIASHAEGNYTNVSGKYSHSEGQATSVEGRSSHAEGYLTRVGDTRAAHSEGYGDYISDDVLIYTTAQGHGSHAEGHATIATGRCTHTAGEYNDDMNTGTSEDNRGPYCEIIGNGTSDTNRSNARTLTWTGDEWVAGSLEAGANLTIGKGTADEVTVTAAQLNDIAALKVYAVDMTNWQSAYTSQLAVGFNRIDFGYLTSNLSLTGFEPGRQYYVSMLVNGYGTTSGGDPVFITGGHIVDASDNTSNYITADPDGKLNFDAYLDIYNTNASNGHSLYVGATVFVKG